MIVKRYQTRYIPETIPWTEEEIETTYKARHAKAPWWNKPSFDDFRWRRKPNPVYEALRRGDLVLDPGWRVVNSEHDGCGIRLLLESDLEVPDEETK